MVDVLLPYVTAMVNTSLREGRLPSSHKHAVVTPLLKKTELDPEELSNYRPVSQFDIPVKTGRESGLVMARQLPERTQFDAAAQVCIPTSSQHGDSTVESAI